MTLLEFLAAREDPASPVAWLGLDEYRDWLVYVTAQEGKPVRPMISRPRADFERTLLTTDLTISEAAPGTGGAQRTFAFGARKTPLAPPEGGATAAVVDATDKVPASSGYDAWDDYIKLVSDDAPPPPSHNDDPASGAAHDPAVMLQPVPAPASAEDKDALDTLTQEYERLANKATKLFDLASPPAAMIDDLVTDLTRQIDNFEGQQQMIAGRSDLAAFPAKLHNVLLMLRLLVGRAESERSVVSMPWALKARAELRDARAKGTSSASPSAPPARAATPPAAPVASPRGAAAAPPPAAPTDALAAIQRQLAALTHEIATLKATRSPLPPPATGPKPPTPAPASAHSKALAESMARHAEAMRERQQWFDKAMKDHREQQAIYDKQNADWLAEFKKR